MTDSIEQNVNTYSRPSALKITDLRLVNLVNVQFIHDVSLSGVHRTVV